MIAIISEKPSVGMDIARVVGADTRNDGYCSGNGYMVTWSLGHLVSLAMPDTYGYTKTAAEDLPMLPDPFRLVSRQMRTDKLLMFFTLISIFPLCYWCVWSAMAGNYFKNRLSIAQSAVFVNYLSGRMAE